MTVLNLFSKRQRRLRGDVSDVFTYTCLHQPALLSVEVMASGTSGYATILLLPLVLVT